MKISTVNCDEELTRILSSKFELNNEDNTIPIFFNWLGEQNEKPDEIINQIKHLEEAVSQKRKILIFDRDLSLQDQHISYLLEKNVTLAEPALNHRREFIWLPFPIETSENPSLRIQEKNMIFMFLIMIIQQKQY